MSENKLERMGRVKHEDFGPCVKVNVRSWSGTKEVWDEMLIPKEQYRFLMHPRHPTGFYVNDSKDRPWVKAGDACSISPSVSYYGDLVKYAECRWTDPNAIKRVDPSQIVSDTEVVIDPVTMKPTLPDGTTLPPAK